MYNKAQKPSSNKTYLGYHNLTLCSQGPPAKPGSPSDGSMIANFSFNFEIAFLFPYINAVVERGELFPGNAYIRFYFDQWICLLYPEKGCASPFYSLKDAQSFIERLIFFLQDIYSRIDEIKPNHTVLNRVSAIDILKLLPKTNCRKCGYKSCLAFAAMLSKQETIPGLCPNINPPISQKAIYPVYDKMGSLRETVSIEVDTTINHQAFHKSNQDMDEKSESKLDSDLTNREIEVLQMMARGSTNKEISHMLQISPHTVKSHVIHIFNKIGVNDRTQAAVWASKQNLI